MYMNHSHKFEVYVKTPLLWYEVTEGGHVSQEKQQCRACLGRHVRFV